MKASPIVQRVFMIAGVIVALWAAGAGRANAQESAPPHCVGSHIFDTSAPLNCHYAAATFTPDSDSWTFLFDPNNSITITTKVHYPFQLFVEQIPMTQEEYAARVAGTPFEESDCWPTLGTDCVFYRVYGEDVDRSAYGKEVDYLVGFTFPPIKGIKKHDLMLLRSSEESEPIPYDGFSPSSFDEETKTKIKKHYLVHDDTGVGGEASGLSDCIVALQRERPKKK